MSEATIGPIELTHAHLYDSNTLQIDGYEEFTIICTNKEARQIMGLAQPTTKNTYHNINTISTSNPWGIVWIDTSTTLHSNEDLTHRGWYLIHDAIPTTDLGADYVHLAVTIEKLSPYEHEYLEMDYTHGVNDNTPIEHSYTDLTQTYQLNETFTSYDDTNTWHPKYTYNMVTPGIAASGGKLVLTGASSTNWTWGYNWTTLQETLPDSFTAEFTLEWDALPAGGAAGHHLNLFLMDGKPNNVTEYGYKDYIRSVLDVTSSGAILSFSKQVRGQYTTLTPFYSLTSDQKTPAIKLELSGGSGTSTLTVWLDKGYTSGTPAVYTKVFGPANTGVNFDVGRYLLYSMENASSTSATVRSDYCQIYTYDESNPPNIVSLPYSCTPTVAADFTRPGVNGDIPCYANPTTELHFTTTPVNYYSGAVKGYNSEYTGSTPNLITNLDDTLTPGKFYFHNDLIKITVDSNTTTPIFISYPCCPCFQELQFIGIGGPVNLIKPLLLSPERQTYQINDTKWTLSRGKQHVKVEHPSTPLTYTLMSNYYYDTTPLTTPAADTDLTMTTQYYVNAYDIAASPCFQIIQTEPTTIKTDSIPAADITGLGWYDPTETTPSYNHYISLAREFMIQPHTSVNIRQV